MSIERKEADLIKIQNALLILKSETNISAIQTALTVMFQMIADRMVEEIAEERGG